MWPSRGEALSHTLAAEQAIADLTADALSQWVSSIGREVLPTFASQLAASGSSFNGDPNSQPDPPPNFSAFTSASSSGSWDQLSETLILSGLAGIWALAAWQTLKALGNDTISDVSGESRERVDVETLKLPREVIKVLHRATDLDKAQISNIVESMTTAPGYRNQVLDAIAAQRQLVADVPALVQRAVETAVRDLGAYPDNNLVRLTVSQTMKPASVEMRDLCRDQGYQAAGVQNDAVLAVAKTDDQADELEKLWIATIDGRTRDTHFAADGQRAPLKGKFTVGGVELDRPGDPTGPAREVRNCRCRVGVLARDERLPDEVDRHTERGEGNSTVRNRHGSQADEVARRADKGVIRARDDDQDGLGRTAAGGISMSRSVTAAVGDRTPDGGTIVAEGLITDDGLTITTDQLADDGSDDESAGEMYRTFSDQPVAMIGTPTSDGRLIASDVALTVRECPLPLMWMKQSGSGYGGHTEAFTVGVIESASLGDGVITASGYMLNTPEADEASAELAHGVTAPSVDLGATEWMLTDENGKEISEEDWYNMPMDATVYQTITAAELIGTTLVATPAFGTTKLSLNSERESRNVAVVASAAEEFRPRVYPAAMFAKPTLTGPTLPTMDDTGRIFGHLACFGECHRSIQSQCVMAPRSKTNYNHFHTSPAVRTDDGRSVAVGRLTVGTGHASDRVNGPAAMAHYDNTGTCFALVHVYEDEFGISFSGVAHPAATAEQIEAGITAPLSGDWRDFGGGLELVAALAVNTPGFAARGRDHDDGRPATLVASLGPAPTARGGTEGLTVDQIERIVTMTLDKSRHALEIEDLMERAQRTVGPLPTPNEEIARLLEGRT